VKLLTREDADKIYDLLVAEAGAPEYDRSSFIWHHSEDRLASSTPSEWRFQGKLGFGGKFYVEDRGWRVGYYGREDLTPERDAIVERVNARLLALRAEHAPLEV